MSDQDKSERFEEKFWPYLGAAYNLARWLTRRDQDAQDVVQEAMLRAFRFFEGYRGGDERAWLLTIVRNTCYTWLRQNRSQEFADSPEVLWAEFPDQAPGPETQALQKSGQERLRQAMERLPLEFREALILRELEGLSYKEIGAVTGLPMGTVMSRLARARAQLQRAILGQRPGEIHHDL